MGRVFGAKYRAESRLGAGGFGTVLLCTQMHGDQDLGHVVLKVLHGDLASSDDVRRRFVNEARAARKLNGPHAVKVFDLAYDEEGVPYIVMEYLAGKSLSDLLLEMQTLPLARALNIGYQVTEALAECHEQGIIHRDLKPDNILLLEGRREDFVKILDFGIARVPSPTGPVTTTLMGTPMYMSPEQLLQQPLDHRADIFALGVVLFECLTGQPPIDTPIDSPSFAAYVIRNVGEKPRPLRSLLPKAPEALERLLSSMMAKAPSDRPTDMATVGAALAAISSARSTESHGSVIPESSALSVVETTLRPHRNAPGDAEASLDQGEMAWRSRRSWFAVMTPVLILALLVVGVLMWPRVFQGRGSTGVPDPSGSATETRKDSGVVRGGDVTTRAITTPGGQEPSASGSGSVSTEAPTKDPAMAPTSFHDAGAARPYTEALPPEGIATPKHTTAVRPHPPLRLSPPRVPEPRPRIRPRASSPDSKEADDPFGKVR